jgi:5-methyltetrahydropteroyltriglutamate--homocysteine methyltransferase
MSATVLGYPRIGRHQELRKATDAYLRGDSDAAALLDVAATIRRDGWLTLRDVGIDEVPCNDFSLYDHMLDTAMFLNALPARHRPRVDPRRPEDEAGDDASLRRYFALARGTDDAAPLETATWFDTNYRYLVPEIDPRVRLSLDARKPLRELSEARVLGLDARPVVVGPVTFLLLSKPAAGAPSEFEPLSLLGDVLPLYGGFLARLHAAGARWVQFDEPVLAREQPPEVLNAARTTYETLSVVPHRPRILVATYFGSVGDALPILRNAPIEGVALDFTGPGRANLDALAASGGLPGKRLVAGVVDGRNVWVNDSRETLAVLGMLRRLADELVVSSSCSLLHVPLDVSRETNPDSTMSAGLSLARQKADEIATLARALTDGLRPV